MSDNALQWLENNGEKARAANSFAEFCDSQGSLGALYKTYTWLERTWKVYKRLGTICWRPPALPDAVSFADVFESVKMVKSVNVPGQPHRYPAGHAYLWCGLSRNVGGDRGWAMPHNSPRRYVMDRAEADAAFEKAYGPGQTSHHARFGKVERWVACAMPRPEHGFTFDSYEIVKREGEFLVLGHYQQYCGDTWIALLDDSTPIESMLSQADRDFIEADRAAELAAWPDAVPA